MKDRFGEEIRIGLYVTKPYTNTISDPMLSLSVVQIHKEDVELYIRSNAPVPFQDFSVEWYLMRGTYPSEHFSYGYQFYRLRDAEVAASAATTLKKIKAGMQKKAQQEGAPTSFGVYVARICNILKINDIVFKGNVNPQATGSGYDAYFHEYLSPGLAVSRLDEIVQKEIARYDLPEVPQKIAA